MTSLTLFLTSPALFWGTLFMAWTVIVLFGVALHVRKTRGYFK